MGRGVGAARTPSHERLVDARAAWARGPLRRGDAGRLLPRHPPPATRERRPVAAAGHQFRIDWHDAQNGSTPPPYHAPQRVHPGRPPRRAAHRRRGDRRLHVAAPGGVGRTRASASRPAARRRGASVRGSCPSSTCGCPTPPSATASRPDTRPTAGAAVVDRLAPRRVPEHGGRRHPPCSRPERRSSCRSRPRWPAWPSSPGRPASCWPSPPPTRRSWHDRRAEPGRCRADRPGRSRRRTTVPS